MPRCLHYVTSWLLGEAMLLVLVGDGAHHEVHARDREAESASEGRACAEVVVRGAVEVLEDEVRLHGGTSRSGRAAKWRGGRGGGGRLGVRCQDAEMRWASLLRAGWWKSERTCSKGSCWPKTGAVRDTMLRDWARTGAMALLVARRRAFMVREVWRVCVKSEVSGR